MDESSPEKILGNFLNLASIEINGKNPWDIRVHNKLFFERLLSGGSLALGESYMDGWWDCDALDQFFDRIFRKGLDKQIKSKSLKALWTFLKVKLLNAQNRRKAYEIGEQHYDIGNDLFSIMLDENMNYSCGYWENAKTLDEAQAAKMNLICEKIGLRPGMKVLDIGCGWGGFAKYAAEKYKARVCGITVSKEQMGYANKFCQGLDVKISMQDYRTIDEKFDRIISIGMFEHVGEKNYRTYMQVVHKCLKKDGLFLLHSIGGNISVNSTDPWIEKYIFPNSMLPSVKQIAMATEGLFVLEDWHSFGQDYDITLLNWYDNFVKNWNKIKNNYNNRFYRMWTYYLLACAGSFRARVNQVWEVVFSKHGIKGGYQHRI